MSSSKQKKPFLRKGTRQFLSNAQVRSQSTKPKIVDFGQPQEDYNPAPPFKNKFSQNIDPNYDEIKIKVGPSVKNTQQPKPQQSIQLKKQQKPVIQAPMRNADTSANKLRQNSLTKKKSAALSDYLDNESETFNDYAVKKTPTGMKAESGYKKMQQKNIQPQKKPTPKASMKHTFLVQQQDQDEQQTPNFFENDSFKPISNPLKNRQPISNDKVPSNNRNWAGNPVPKKKLQSSDEGQANQEINFVSDKSDEQEQITNQKKSNKQMKNGYQNIQKTVSQYQQQNTETQPTVSKVKMNYFNKGNEKAKVAVVQQQKQRLIQKKLSINDIPKELKQKIVKQTIAQKQQELHQELQKLKQKFSVVKREKQKIQQDQKALVKARQQFEKEIEQKNREFEQKLKNENSKLARQKKYMKDAQMQGQGDRKVKNQLEETKKLVEKQRQQKKKIESKYKIEIQNLRKKLGQQTSKNKILTEQIKMLEYGQIIQKQQMQEIAKQQKKTSVQIQLQRGVDYWAEAPRTTYLSRFFQEGFSLIQMDLAKFNYEENQYFQYYLRIKDDHSPLESESADADRAKRQYKNGKVEVEQFKKFLKEIYPFNYTIVSLCNGDIKQILPEGILIYFSQNSGATQYCIKSKTEQKQIVYFPNSETVQMKVVRIGDARGNFNQVYCCGHLKRTLNDGTAILQKKDKKGKIISMPYT